MASILCYRESTWYYLYFGFVLSVFVSCNVDKSSGYKREY